MRPDSEVEEVAVDVEEDGVNHEMDWEEEVWIMEEAVDDCDTSGELPAVCCCLECCCWFGYILLLPSERQGLSLFPPLAFVSEDALEGDFSPVDPVDGGADASAVSVKK